MCLFSDLNLSGFSFYPWVLVISFFCKLMRHVAFFPQGGTYTLKSNQLSSSFGISNAICAGEKWGKARAVPVSHFSSCTHNQRGTGQVAGAAVLAVVFPFWAAKWWLWESSPKHSLVQQMWIVYFVAQQELRCPPTHDLQILSMKGNKGIWQVLTHSLRLEYSSTAPFNGGKNGI